jgi:hypothetical protein
MKTVRTRIAVAMLGVALTIAGVGASYAQVRRQHMSSDGSTYCISGPEITYDSASDYYSAKFENRCSFGIRIDYTYYTGGRTMTNSRYLPEYSTGSVLILHSDTIDWSEVF